MIYVADIIFAVVFLAEMIALVSGTWAKVKALLSFDLTLTRGPTSGSRTACGAASLRTSCRRGASSTLSSSHSQSHTSA